MSYIDTLTYYRVVHRLSDKLSMSDIYSMFPYERDIFVMLTEEDNRRQEELENKSNGKHYL